ncbi:Spiroplasmavirus-related protein [Spiroplasma kunkelii CR2-3x]|uniref:Spiroplasmavirus-related protein n=1 Tax=Spiroplasma kunkelii CR2-3x TaxID=273035 RepID=A0A0K2JIS9_SPIKU|nr:DUF3688 family protein [Spiroplasma kunkelii]ALA98141.1 Spiroplasmavirus-related protein [Spiroplasma kunkelii CR2-3x]
MKKWLSIIGTIGLTATSTTTLISCNKKNNNNENKENNKPEISYTPQQPPEKSNWKLIALTNRGRQLEKKEDKWYFLIYSAWNLQTRSAYKTVLKINSKWDVLNLAGNIKFDNYNFSLKRVEAMYQWDGNGEPETPTINKDTGEITDWKEQKGTK